MGGKGKSGRSDNELVRLENTRRGHFKFWSVKVYGAVQHVTWGRIGTRGVTLTRLFDTRDECREATDALVASKLGRGYKLASVESR